MIGCIKNVRAIEGYCFIIGEDGVERFAHRTACVGMTLSSTLVGAYVEFTPGFRGKGPCALGVMLVPSTPAAGIPTGRVVIPSPEMTEPDRAV